MLPYGNLFIQDDRRGWENFACVMTQAVLAMGVLGTPGGCAIESVMKT